MAKHLKITIKNTQIAEAIDLGGLKGKLAAKKKAEKEEVAKQEESEKKVSPPKPTAKKKPVKEKEQPTQQVQEEDTTVKEESPRIRARSKSVFAGPVPGEEIPAPPAAEEAPTKIEAEEIREQKFAPKTNGKPPLSEGEELRRRLFGEDIVTQKEEATPSSSLLSAPLETPVQPVIEEKQPVTPTKAPESKEPQAPPKPTQFREPAPREQTRLGPTGKHIKDLLPPRPPARQQPPPQRAAPHRHAPPPPAAKEETQRPRTRGPAETEESGAARKGGGKVSPKEFRDVKPSRRQENVPTFTARDRHGLHEEGEQRWRKKRKPGRAIQEEIAPVRPTTLKVRLPISIKDLAVEMKLKSSQLIAKLFLQGIVVTLNDLLDDETTVQLLGQEFGCEITIDTTEEKRIQITDKTVREEIKETTPENLVFRSPVVAFMGHVDHGKTSLIDAIRKSNRVAGEAGAITQHIGAFRCHTPVGDITVLDTPGHEAFSAMRARGADVTDIVVLVVAGDEGMRQQTLEAVQHARAAKVTIVVAINKADKPGFNPETVYRQLAENDMLPEVWGGQILTVNCSAVTGAGIKELLESLALQAEVLELRANPQTRARGTVLESEMHKGLGAVTTVLIQNGTLRRGDALVFDQYWGHVKTMRDELGRDLMEAGPSAPVSITGLSGLPQAGEEFISVKNEREAREIADVRRLNVRQTGVQQKKVLTAENLLQQATPTSKKVLNLVLRADVQGSLEALKTALNKIESTKAEVNIISTGVGEVSESDIQLAVTSKAVVLGFHTAVEGHAASMIKQLNIQVRLHDIIYHAVDDVKAIMTNMLDKIARETDRGKAEVKALFKSSQTGIIAGCMVVDGTISRNNHIRVIRNGEIIARSPIASLRRVKEDVKEVSKGMECGIVLSKFSDVQAGDTLEAYEVTYITQEL